MKVFRTSSVIVVAFLTGLLPVFGQKSDKETRPIEARPFEALYIGLRVAETGGFGADSSRMYTETLNELRSLPGHAKHLGDRIEILTQKRMSGRDRDSLFWTLSQVASSEAIEQCGRFLFDERDPDANSEVSVLDGLVPLKNYEAAASALGEILGDKSPVTKRKPSSYRIEDIRLIQMWWKENHPTSPQSSKVAEAKEYSDYLAHSERLPVYVEVPEDEIRRFEADVTGDGTLEVFFTKSSLRDGKLGHLWSIYQRHRDGSLHLLGDVTFPMDVLTPSKWKQDPSKYGFYTFFPSGASQGSLTFYEVEAAGVVLRESRKISPNSTNKQEYDSLFGGNATRDRPKIELKRVPVSAVTPPPAGASQARASEGAGDAPNGLPK